MSIPYFCLHGSKINWKHEARRKTNLQQALSQFASMRIWATVFWSLVFHSSITNCGTLRWGLLWCWIIRRIRCFAASRRRSYGVGHDQHYIYACAIVTISYVKAIYFYNSCGVFIILYICDTAHVFFTACDQGRSPAACAAASCHLWMEQSLTQLMDPPAGRGDKDKGWNSLWLICFEIICQGIHIVVRLSLHDAMMSIE